MKNGINPSLALVIASIVTIIFLWIGFFTRLYDGSAYLWCLTGTLVAIWFIIAALIDSAV